MVSLTATPDPAPGQPHWRDTFRFVAEIARTQPLPVLMMSLLQLVGNARVGVYLAAQGGMVDAFLEQDARKALVWALAFVIANAIEEVYGVVEPLLLAVISDRTVHRMQRRVLERAASTPLIAFEHGPFSTRLLRASDNLGGKLASLMYSLTQSIQVLVMALSVIAAVWFISPWLPLILIAGAGPALLLEFRVASTIQEALQKHARGSQLLGRIEAIVRDREAAAELRMFQNGPDLMARWRTIRGARGTTWSPPRRRGCEPVAPASWCEARPSQSQSVWRCGRSPANGSRSARGWWQPRASASSRGSRGGWS